MAAKNLAHFFSKAALDQLCYANKPGQAFQPSSTLQPQLNSSRLVRLLFFITHLSIYTRSESEKNTT